MNDRRRWNDKYRRGEHASPEPSPLLVERAALLPERGRAVDLAGGAGRHAIWLARRGLDVTLADVSDEALELARRAARDAGVSLRLLRTDLEADPPPPGPWDLILSVHFLWRPLLARLPSLLAPGGVLVVIQPTQSNLQRHAKPPARFLLGDGELPRLVRDLEVVDYQEGWLAAGRHEAVLVARREPPRA